MQTVGCWNFFFFTVPPKSILHLLLSSLKARKIRVDYLHFQ